MKTFVIKSTALKQKFATLLVATCAVIALAASPKAHAQSEASVVLSMLPVASIVVVGAASAAAGAVVAVPVILSTAGTVLVVKTVESTARGTVYVLERASDGATASVELVGRAAGGASIVAGTAVTVSVIGAGVVLSALGEAIAFIPNALGKSLLHNERITFQYRAAECTVASPPCSLPWRWAWTAQRHKGGGHRPGDSRVAVQTQRQGVQIPAAPCPSVS
jgi:hypothetical protein